MDLYIFSLVVHRLQVSEMKAKLQPTFLVFKVCVRVCKPMKAVLPLNIASVYHSLTSATYA